MICPHCGKDSIPTFKAWIKAWMGTNICPECGKPSTMKKQIHSDIISGLLGLIPVIIAIVTRKPVYLLIFFPVILIIDYLIDYKTRSLVKIEPIEIKKPDGETILQLPKHSAAGITSAVMSAIVFLIIFIQIARLILGDASVNGVLSLIVALVFQLAVILGVIFGIIGLLAKNTRKGLAAFGLFSTGFFLVMQILIVVVILITKPGS